MQAKEERARSLQDEAGQEKIVALRRAHSAKVQGQFCTISARLPALAAKADTLSTQKVERELKLLERNRGSLAHTCAVTGIRDALDQLGGRAAFAILNMWEQPDVVKEIMEQVVPPGVLLLVGPAFLHGNPAGQCMERAAAGAVCAGAGRLPLAVAGGQSAASLLVGHSTAAEAVAGSELVRALLDSDLVKKGVPGLTMAYNG